MPGIDDTAQPIDVVKPVTVQLPDGDADVLVTPDGQVTVRVPVDGDGWATMPPDAAAQLGSLLSLTAGAALGYADALSELEPEVQALRDQLADAGGVVEVAR